MALISNIQASELAFENGNRKFLISEILDFSDKKTNKKNVRFLTAFLAKNMAFLDILGICNTPHDFLKGFQNFSF